MPTCQNCSRAKATITIPEAQRVNPDIAKVCADCLPMCEWYEWTVKVRVKITGTWVEDGYDLNPPARLEEQLRDAFRPYMANEDEYEVLDITLESAPDPDRIAKCQGYHVGPAKLPVYS